MICKWRGPKSGSCDKEGTPLKAADGAVWTHLCEEHEKQLDAHIASGESKRIFGAWVAARGGPAAAARDML